MLPLCVALLACSPPDAAPDTELADAMAEADEATAMTFGGPPLQPCALLSRAEVAAAIGPLAGDPVQPPEDAADTAEARCLWRAEGDRVLSLAGSGEGGPERLAVLEAAEPVPVEGAWDDARLQGCCLLHAVADDVLLSLDFSAAGIDLARAAKLMDLALARRHDPLDAP